MAEVKVFIKKFYNEEEQFSTRDVAVVKEKISEGIDLWAVLSDGGSSWITKSPVLKVEYCLGAIVLKLANGDVIATSGLDNNQRNISNCWFISNSGNMYKSVSEAQKALASGENLCAENYYIRTSRIQNFIDEKTFETCTGSIYTII